MESIQGLLDFGWWLRLVAVATYAAAFVGYAARLAVQKLKLDRAATALAALAVTAHTAYLVTRWVAAGRIEILARQATGDVLSSTDRFWYMVSHPPYTNLFDALNFVAWAMMVCYLIIERKWGLRIVGVLAVALALVAMGEASLVTDKQIEPLVPALQSYWILIHVGMLFVSYSLFTLGAICALLYLVRTGTATALLGGVQAAAAALLLALMGGTRLLFGATFEMAPGWEHQIASRLHPGKLLTVTTAVHVVPPGSDKAVKFLAPVAGVGPLLLAAVLLLAAGAVVYFRARKGPEEGVRGRGYKIVAAGFALLTLGLCYEARPRFSGGAYQPLVRRVEAFLDKRLEAALAVRERRAARLLALDDRVVEIVEALKARGLKSPYLKPFVVARCNPLRFRKDATMDFGEALAAAERAAEKFDPEKIRPQDLAASGGPPEPPE